MTNLIMDEGMLQMYAEATPNLAVVVADEQLEAWASYFCGEPRLHNALFFDVFVSNPDHYCNMVGVIPRPHNSALPSPADMRNLLPAQRLVMGRSV